MLELGTQDSCVHWGRESDCGNKVLVHAEMSGRELTGRFGSHSIVVLVRAKRWCEISQEEEVK